LRGASDLWWFIQGKRLSSLLYPLINQRSQQFMQKAWGTIIIENTVFVT
jgi:hypothetical protein